MSTTIEAVREKTPIFLFKKECVDCTHLNAAGTKTLKCHYAIPNSQGQCNEDCPAAEHYLVIGFNPDRVSTSYVKATGSGNNKRIIAIVQAVNNQHEDVQSQFWSMVQYKTALSLGAVGFDEAPQEEVADDQGGQQEQYAEQQPLEIVNTQQAPHHAAAHHAHQGQGFEIEVPAASAEQVDQYATGAQEVDTNEWNEE